MVKNYLLLLLLSLFCGILWRVELEYHGWDGLIWIRYFHWSIPIGIFLFIIWVNFRVYNFVENNKKIILFNIIAVIYSFVMYVLVQISLESIFITGPSAMFFYFTFPESLILTFKLLIFIAMIFNPVVISLSLRLIRLKLDRWDIVVYFTVLLLSIPISLYLLEVIDHKGVSDLIHTLKSGFIIPFVVFALGSLFINIKEFKPLSIDSNK